MHFHVVGEIEEQQGACIVKANLTRAAVKFCNVPALQTPSSDTAFNRSVGNSETVCSNVWLTPIVCSSHLEVAQPFKLHLQVYIIFVVPFI